MTIIHNNLHQFTEYLEMADFSTHQYLLLTEEPILIHTGTARNAETIIPQIKQLLGERPLKIFLCRILNQMNAADYQPWLKNFLRQLLFAPK